MYEVNTENLDTENTSVTSKLLVVKYADGQVLPPRLLKRELQDNITFFY